MSNAFVLHQLVFMLGMTLILYTLRHGDAGVFAILSSVNPVIVLQLVWLIYKHSPAWRAPRLLPPEQLSLCKLLNTV
jgi:drug/metabolite transporter (DMT)-like permease